MKQLNHVFRYMPLFIVYSALAYGQAAAIASPIQWSGNGHWYETVVTYHPDSPPSDSPSWGEARAAAEDMNHMGLPGRLATIESAEEDAFILSSGLLDTGVGGELWLGGWQNPASPDYAEPDGGWEWVYLPSEPEYPYQPLAYTNWDEIQPDDHLGQEDHLTIQTWDGQWNDLYEFWGADDTPAGYIVEYVPEPAALSLLALGGFAVLRRRHAA